MKKKKALGQKISVDNPQSGALQRRGQRSNRDFNVQKEKQRLCLLLMEVLGIDLGRGRGGTKSEGLWFKTKKD